MAATEYLASSLRQEVFLLAHSWSSQSILARTHCGRGQGTSVADVGVSSQRMDWDMNAGALLICLFPLVWSGSSGHGTVSPAFRLRLSASVRPLWKHPRPQRHVAQGISSPLGFMRMRYHLFCSLYWSLNPADPLIEALQDVHSEDRPLSSGANLNERFF